MSHKMIALSLGFGALILLSGRSYAQPTTCGLREEIVNQLHSRYTETRRAVALADTNAVLEVFAAESGSWTILITRTNGVSCMIASGQAFEAVQEPLPASGTTL